MLESDLRRWVLLAAILALRVTANADSTTQVQSPDGRNAIELHIQRNEQVRIEIKRDNRTIVRPSAVRPILDGVGAISEGARLVSSDTGKVNQEFALPWGKTSRVVDHYCFAVVTLAAQELTWQIELRAYNDGVAFRYRVPKQPALSAYRLRNETSKGP